MNTYSWLVRREFWENRAIWMLPCVIGVVLVLAALFGRIDLVAMASPEQSRAIGVTALFAFGMTFFLVMTIYSSWYLLDCLHADRRDRSILFWKSLPISDSKTVIAKLFTGLIAIPLVYFLAADLATALIAFIVSMRMRATFGSALWQPDVWLQLQALWLYLIVTTAIWYLPFAGWLMAVSAWARRAVMLWSILPLLALYLLERQFFGTHYLGSALAERTFGYGPAAFHDPSAQVGWISTPLDSGSLSTPKNVWLLLDPAGFFSSPHTWIGVVVGAVFILAAIQLRLRRSEAG